MTTYIQTLVETVRSSKSNLLIETMPLLSRRLCENPPTEIQFPVLVNLDNSPSMSGSGGIDIVQQVLPKFLEDSRRVPSIRSSLFMQFGLFGESNPLHLAGPFSSVMELEPPNLDLSAGTPLCARIVSSIELLIAARKIVSRQFNLDMRHAWLLEMTDGYATDSDLHEKARYAVQSRAMDYNIEVHLFGVGPTADMGFLESLAQPHRPPQKLESVEDFSQLFEWLWRSCEIISASALHQVLEIPAFDGTLIPTQGRS